MTFTANGKFPFMFPQKNNKYTRIAQNNSGVYDLLEKSYLTSLGNGKRKAGKEEKTWSRGHLCRLPFAVNAMQIL